MMNSTDNMVSLYSHRLEEFNINQVVTDARNKLSEWCNNSHKIIDDFYKQKLAELELHTNETKIQYEEKKGRIQSHLSQLKNQQERNETDRTAIQFIINTVQRDLTDIEQMCIHIKYRLIDIDDSYIQIGKKFSFKDLSSDFVNLGYSPTSSSAITSNDQFLLLHQDPYLLLIDRDTRLVNQCSWTYGWIRDMCWSSTLYSFIILTAESIYITDDRIQAINPFKNQLPQVWFSCTCNDKSLYISTCEWGSSIFELSLSSSPTLVNQWKPPLTCGIYEGINDMKYNNTALALMIKDSEKQNRRIDLKVASTLNTLWSLPLGTTADIRLFTCCPLKYNEWLVIDSASSSIFHVTAQGKFKDTWRCNSVPYRANLFGSNLLTIAAESNLSFHKIQT